MRPLRITLPFLVLIIAVVAVGSRSGAFQPQLAAVELQVARSYRPYVALSGPHSAIDDQRLLRVTGKDSWEALWREHRGEAIERSAGGWPLTPEIDFTQCVVIAQFRGASWNCNGEFVVSVDEFDDHVRLRFDSSTFQTEGPDGGGVRVTPFGIWVLPRVHGKRLVVEENVQGLIGQPAQWKSRALFDAL